MSRFTKWVCRVWNDPNPVVFKEAGRIAAMSTEERVAERAKAWAGVKRNWATSWAAAEAAHPSPSPPPLPPPPKPKVFSGAQKVGVAAAIIVSPWFWPIALFPSIVRKTARISASVKEPVAAPEVRSEPDVPASLERLWKLKADGAINQAEYDAAKASIIKPDGT